MVGDLAYAMGTTSICGLGQVAAQPDHLVLKYFPEDLNKYLQVAAERSRERDSACTTEAACDLSNDRREQHHEYSSSRPGDIDSQLITLPPDWPRSRTSASS